MQPAGADTAVDAGPFNFLGWEFKPIELEDRHVLAPFLKRHPHRLSGYTFAAMIAWDHLLKFAWTFATPETLLVSIESKGARHLIEPRGALDPVLQDEILARAAQLDYPLRLFMIDQRFLDAHPAFVARFEVALHSEESHYLYRASDLAQLPGRKYAAKRNLIAQAERQYRWTTEALTPENHEAAFDLLRRIHEEDGPESESFQQDTRALEYTLRHLAELAQHGNLVRVEGRPAALSICEPIADDTVAIHFERASRSYKGMYQVVTNEAAKAIVAAGYEYINREEDLGNEGLRKAKQSYHPIEIIGSFSLTLRR